MIKQTKTLKQFSELTPSELHRISGGDWWDKFINYLPKVGRFGEQNNKHKIG